MIEANEEFTNSLQKPKKPRTDKQKEALKKAQIKRKENCDRRKKEKLEESKQINPSLNGINEDYEEVTEENLECNKVGVPLKQTLERDPQYEEWLKQQALSKPKPKPKRKTKKKVIVQQPEEDSSSEEEIIYVPAPKKKKKKKKVVIQAPESSSEEEEEVYEPEPQQSYSQPNRRLRYSDVFKF